MASVVETSGYQCAVCGASAIGVTVSGPTVADQRPYCARHSPAETDRHADEIRRLRVALRQAREALREVAADDDPRDGCAHSDAAKAALAKIAEVLGDAD